MLLDIEELSDLAIVPVHVSSDEASRDWLRVKYAGIGVGIVTYRACVAGGDGDVRRGNQHILHHIVGPLGNYVGKGRLGRLPVHIIFRQA